MNILIKSLQLFNGIDSYITLFNESTTVFNARTCNEPPLLILMRERPDYYQESPLGKSVDYCASN